ncbi:hypothetical protein STANM309S_00386 [Streptomyces tanashiensis]
MPVGDPGGDDDVRARRDGDAVDHGGGDGSSADGRGGGEETHGLLEDLGDVGQRVEVGGTGGTAGEDPVDLLMGPLQRFRVPAEEVQGEGEGGGRGLVPGEQEDEDLFAQLGGVEAAVLGALLAPTSRVRRSSPSAEARPEARRSAMIRSQTSYSARWTAAALRLPGVGQSRGTLSRAYPRLST